MSLVKSHDLETPEISKGPESARDIDIICDLGFLQRIIDAKDGAHKWFCLRASGPDRKGKPILMGDGRDQTTINKLCQACRDGWSWRQSQKLSADHIKAIKRFGDAELEAHIWACNNPEAPYSQLSLDPKHPFYCSKTNRRETQDKKCRVEPCDYFFHQVTKITVKDTPQYEELQKQLEAK